MQAVRGRLMAGIDYTPTSAQELAAQQQPGPHSKARQEPAPEVLDKSLALTLSLQVRLASTCGIDSAPTQPGSGPCQALLRELHLGKACTWCLEGSRRRGLPSPR